MAKYNKKLKINLVDNISIYLPLILSVIGLLISIKSCNNSNNALVIARKNFELNLDPILIVDFNIDIKNDNYQIILTNDGPKKITDINILKELNIYNLKDSVVQYGYLSYNNKSWKIINELKAGKKYDINIDYTDLVSLSPGLTQEEWNNRDSNEASVVLFKISYRNEPNRSISYIKKYLFVEPIVYFHKFKVYGVDPSISDREDTKNTLKIIDKIERKRPWKYSNPLDFPL